ncbi:unnamed protein product [Rotaria sp. Silwood1]|nr:unnamed protein product [Rotaria sp. Silwood1]CAF1571354.1 unnamed protein product [Rotaria sp. Silwood1]CAF3714948.1 unnamed protein product [Rotaria sp. Silwood1]CAF4946892.1 unnamed protein product [Rotaria sp. Silwood1]
MNKYTHFEDLSNEIFFEIFDYLHALDIFTSFTSLNKRISSILQLIPLRIIISHNHCRQQINYLSSYLTYHDHQVISINIDNICDNSSVINLLFNRHNFINLQSCIFISINPSTILENVIKKIENLKKLSLFCFHDLNDNNINKNDKYNLTQTILMHKSSSLRSIVLKYRYDYLDISNYTSIPSNLLSLSLYISGSRSTVSVYSILPILRFCHKLRYLQISIEQTHLIENNNINISIPTLSINNNDLPILTQLISFNLEIYAICDSRSISYILRCMPNLIRFHFILAIRKSEWFYAGELLDGYLWEQMFELYVPCLSKFDFHMSIFKPLPKLNLDMIVNSFEYFVEKYSNWHMIIDQWTTNRKHREEFVMLRTLNYEKRQSIVNVNIPFIYWDSFKTRSTLPDDHYCFYKNETHLNIYMTWDTPIITWSYPLFSQVTYLCIDMPKKCPSLWKNFLDIINHHHTDDDDNDDDDDINDAEDNVISLSYFVHLSNITNIEFTPNFHISRWKDIQFILQSCPNLIDLKINVQLLISSKLFNNPSLISIFKQIKILKLITEKIYFPSNSAIKFVRRFPSLTHIELKVFSFDNCVSTIDIFLNYLQYLSYTKINYDQITLLDDPFSRDYIIEKRYQLFPNTIFDETIVNVKNNDESVEIWLS